MLNAGIQERLTPAAADEAPPTVDFAEIARSFQQAAQAAGADEFSVYLVSQADNGLGLTPFMDSDYPRIAKRTEHLARQWGDRFTRRARTTTQPCWWVEGEEPLIAASLTRCLWAERVAAPAGAGAALALPLEDENGRAGLVVLWGENIALSMPALADLQARCLSLFMRLTLLRPEPTRAGPSISPRELECLKLTANGKTSEEIAAKLGLSVHTANQYLTNSTQKLNAMNRMHAVAKALRLGLID